MKLNFMEHFQSPFLEAGAVRRSKTTFKFVSCLEVFHEILFYAKYWTLMGSVPLPLLEVGASAL